jgi:hypothetical protein
MKVQYQSNIRHGWDMCYGKEGKEGKVQVIDQIKGFERNPIY